jgi:hypothetical protein
VVGEVNELAIVAGWAESCHIERCADVHGVETCFAEQCGAADGRFVVVK